MIKLSRTEASNVDFINLVNQLNEYLKIVDGDDHTFYNQYNSIDTIKHIIVAYKGTIAIGCGAFKKYNNETVEIKRMFTILEFRGKQVATSILKELENWAKQLSYKSIILETGQRQKEAVKFYKRNHYKIIENFEPYKNVSNSICFEKNL